MNAERAAWRAVGLRRRDRRARAAPRDRPPPHRRGYEAAARPDAMADRPRAVREPAGRRMPTACSTGSAQEFPASGRTPEPPRRPARGAAADPGRQREPGARAAAGAGRRPHPGRGHALRRGHRRARGACSPTAPPVGTDGAVADRAACARRPATPRPRSRASCATSASTGARCWRGARRAASVAWTSPSASWPRRSAALHLRFGGGPAVADRSQRRPSFAGLADEPEAFSSTRPGCRGSC